MKTYISILLIAVAAALAVELNKSLVDADIGTRTSMVVSVVLSVFTLEIARFLLTELPMRLRLTRRLLDPIAKFEGL